MSQVNFVAPEDRQEQLIENLVGCSLFSGNNLALRLFSDLTGGSVVPIVISGQTETIGSTFRQCMPAPSDDFLIYPSVNVDCDISSESVSDTTQSVVITGVNSAGTTLTELANLNGQNRVQLSNQYFRITSLICTSNTQAVEPFADGGLVYVYPRSESVSAGVPDGFMGLIELSKMLGKFGYGFIPPNNTFHIQKISVVSDTIATKILGAHVQFKDCNSSAWTTLLSGSFESGSNSEFNVISMSGLINSANGCDVRIVVVRETGSSTINSCVITIQGVLQPP